MAGFKQRIYRPKMSAENGQAVGAAAIRESGCFSSNPDDHVQFARRYLEMGFDQLYFHYAGKDQKEFLERFGRDVLPKLRDGGDKGRGFRRCGRRRPPALTPLMSAL